MGTETLPTATDGTIIPAAHTNTISDVLQGDFVPRNSSGAPTDIAGALGSTSYAWLKAFIESGYWSLGDIKPHHSYNGAAPIGHGWMLADGRVCSEANYNIEHGAGAWDTYIGSSNLDGLYLPDLTGNKYLAGVAATTQTGAIAITGVGNTGNEINVSHTHTMTAHNHKWHNNNSSSSDDQTYDTSGNAIVLPVGAAKDGVSVAIRDVVVSSPAPLGDSWTENITTVGSSSLSASQDIRPESIEVQYFIRII